MTFPASARNASLGLLAAALALAVLALPAAAAAASGSGAGAAAAGEAAPGGEAASGAEAAPGREAARRLAEAYAPIMMIREQQNPPCDTSEEQYLPSSVDTVLGNPDVVLKRHLPGRGLVPLKRGPRAADIAGLEGDYYLDSPGDALGDTCVYARDFKRLRQAGAAPLAVYAHIARERGRPGFALQYWFYWYFNHFNDLHEGDWEGMQIAFDAPGPRRALETGPSEVILFQHGGGERSGWDDPKLQKEGTHPIVYPAAGSHATFYDSAVYVENGLQGAGMGCDNTTEPLRELRPQPILLPGGEPRRGPFAWLSYGGRWGERQKGLNNGPTGPATKEQWSEPFSWMERQRTTSPRLPGGSVIGPQVTGAFCGVVAAASDLINLEARSPVAAALTVLTILLVLGLYFGLTRWRPVELGELRARRAFGQLVRAARQLYGRHWRTLVPIGLTAMPIVGGAQLLGQWVAGHRGVEDATGIEGVRLALADLINLTGPPVASAVMAAVVIVFVRSVVAGRPAGFAGSYRGMWRRFRRVVASQLLAMAAVFAMAVTVVGIPFAIWKYVSWLFVQQEIIFGDKAVRDAFRGSSELVRGRWWHTVRVAVFFSVAGIVAGPLLGFALIFTSFSLFLINFLGSVVFALLIPFVAVGQTLLYFDLQAREREEPAPPPRARPWRRPRPAGVAASG